MALRVLTILLLLGNFALLTVAAALEPRSKTYLVNFDELLVSRVNATEQGKNTQTTPPRFYNGLAYRGWNTQSTLGEVAGLQPISPINSIFFDILTDYVLGPATLFIDPKRGGTYFALHSTYFGCEIDTAVIRTPFDCTLRTTVTGVDGKNRTWHHQWHANGDINQTMTPLIFPPALFGRVKQVVFSIRGLHNPTSPQHVNAGIFDNISYTVYP